MFDFVISIYNGMYMVFVSIFSLVIFCYALKAIFNMLFGGEENRDGSYALITGCDSGFGHAASYALSKKNVYVFAACLTQEGVQRLEEDDNFTGKAFIMDITKMDDVKDAKKMIEDVVKDKGLWCLFNNAGIFEPGPIEWASVDDMKKTFEVNLWGAVGVTKVMLPLLKQSKGRIINTISMCGRLSFPGLSAYCMSKFAFEAFSDSLRYEMKKFGVSVHIIEPGANITTDLYSRIEGRYKDLNDIQPKEILQQYGVDFHKNAAEKIRNVLLSLGRGRSCSSVVDAYLHAALSSQPKLRYLVGTDAKFCGLLATLPTSIGDLAFTLI